MSESNTDKLRAKCMESLDSDRGVFIYSIEVWPDKIIELLDERDELRTIRDVLKEEVDRMKALLCKTCLGEGAVGRAPDDYYECPACVGAMTELKAENERLSTRADKLQTDLLDMQNTAARAANERDRAAGENERLTARVEELEAKLKTSIQVAPVRDSEPLCIVDEEDQP